MKKLIINILVCLSLLAPGLFHVAAGINIGYPLTKDITIIINNVDLDASSLYQKYMNANSYKAKRKAYTKLYSYLEKQSSPTNDNRVFKGIISYDMAMVAARFNYIDETTSGLENTYKLLIGSDNHRAELVGYIALIHLFQFYNYFGERTLIPCAKLAKEIVENYPETEEYFPEEYKQVKEVYSKWNYNEK